MSLPTLHPYHRPLGSTGLSVSPLGLGTVKLGRDQGVKYPNGFTIPDDDEARMLLAQAREERLLAKDVDIPSAVVLFMGAVQGLVMQSLVTGNLHGLARQGKAVFKLYEAGLLPKPTT